MFITLFSVPETPDIWELLYSLVMKGLYNLCLSLLVAYFSFVFSPSNYVKKKSISLAKLNMASEIVDLGLEKKEEVWSHTECSEYCPHFLWCPMVMPKPELGAGFLLKPVARPASSSWLDWEVWFDLGHLNNCHLLPASTPSLPEKSLTPGRPTQITVTRPISITSDTWRTHAI